jgi:hypothetical protein
VTRQPDVTPHADFHNEHSPIGRVQRLRPALPDRSDRGGELFPDANLQPRAVDACRYFGALLLGAFQGLPKEELPAPGYGDRDGFWRDEPLKPRTAAVAAGTARDPAWAGYVIDTLVAALWAFERSTGSRDGAIEHMSPHERRLAPHNSTGRSYDLASSPITRTRPARLPARCRMTMSTS